MKRTWYLIESRDLDEDDDEDAWCVLEPSRKEMGPEHEDEDVALAFESEEEAQTYINKYMPSGYEARIREIETSMVPLNETRH